MKSNKSYQKRIRITKKGKLIARVPGHNHFNAKRSGSEKQRRARTVGLNIVLTRTDKSRFLGQ